MKIIKYTLVGLFIVVIAAYFLLTDWLIKTVAEQELGKAYGAEVNIGSVSHSLFPATITLNAIELTDARTPTTNKVAIAQAFADVEVGPLLKKKLIANELTIDGITFGQPRKAVGEVYRQPDPAPLFGFPTADDIPSVDELLANSPLQTTHAIEDAQKVYSHYSTTLQSDFAALPNKERVDFYKAEVKKLQSVDLKDPQSLLTAKEKFDELKAKIKADKALFDEFSQHAKQAKVDLSAAKDALSKASQADYQLVQGLIAGDQAALSQVTQRLFGEKAEQYTQYITLALQTIAPMLNDTATEEAPKVPAPGDLPNVWIKQARASVLIDDEPIVSEWANITDQHGLIDSPTTFSIDAAKSALWQAFTTSGEFRLTPDGIDAVQNWAIKGVNLHDLSLSDSERLSANLLKALVATTGSLSINNNQLEGTGNINLADLALAITGTDEFTLALADALEDITALTMKLGLSGDITAPHFSLKSDLDRQLVSAIATSLGADQHGQLAELKNKLQAKISPQLNETTQLLGQAVNWQDLVSGHSESLDGLLKSQLNNAVDANKNKLLEKLKGKLGG
ncbi:TIGR03545 family protein [Alteromonas facilis]|uniref:TIGR03545 family protein n=1 Tax=Alteromonas facilis TaxID=2048004 RepID=UPI000C28A777|nr:TIGR03545 family protein [Alteromonas facilis]